MVASKPAKKAVKAVKSAGVVSKAAPRGLCLHPYLTFAGNCEVAFKAYQKIFGGEFCCLQRFKG